MEKKININDIKYVLFDMDGTLLNSQKQISSKTLETIKELRRRNIKCGIATGRPYYFSRNEIQAVQPDFPVISCNSALIYDHIKNEIISFNAINKKSAKYIFDILIKNGATFLAYTKKKMFSYKKNENSKWLDWINKTNNSFQENFKIEITPINDPNEFDINQYDIIKFLIIYSEISDEQMNNISNDIKHLNDVYWVFSQNEVVDIMPANSDKGVGLKELANLKYIDLNHTLVFGDADNDIPMFKVAKYSVAMGQAREKLKEVATCITDDNNSEGISNFFEKLLLNT